MCGIAGIISPSVEPEVRRNAVERMCAAMTRRGPDDGGIFTSEVADLGMRRLSIFDPANGHQPMMTADGRHHIVFNGAVYNFRELRAELEAAGAVFRTQCDTEVLLAACVQWGPACLRRLRGMFAFAVWDDRERSLFLARDPFGIKPLYYAHDEATFLFASSLSALASSGVVPTQIDPQALDASLSYLAVPAPETIYQGIKSLRPGEQAVFQDGRLAIQTYWDFNDARQGGAARSRRGNFQHELRDRLEESIRAHSLADVPVGAFLSGGLDSAAVVALMQRASGARLKTFSVGFEEREFSEAREAEAAARHLGTDHTTFILTGARVAEDLGALVAAFDQPSGDGLNTYYASQVARAGGVTVALSGLGGDELFGGYPWFETTPRLARWLPWWRSLPGPLRDHLLARLQRGDMRRRKLADFLRHARDIHELAALQRRVFPESIRRDLLHGDVRFTPHSELARLREELREAAPTEVVSAWEMRTYMADVLLRDSDTMSMHHSLELRVPFVDRPLVEWLFNQRPGYKHNLAHPKQALARAVHELLPAGTARRPKRGFTLPMNRWMRGPLRPQLEEIFSLSSVTRSGLFDADGVQGCWQSFVSGNDPREWSRVWTLAIAVAFANRTPHAPAQRS